MCRLSGRSHESCLLISSHVLAAAANSSTRTKPLAKSLFQVQEKPELFPSLVIFLAAHRTRICPSNTPQVRFVAVLTHLFLMRQPEPRQVPVLAHLFFDAVAGACALLILYSMRRPGGGSAHAALKMKTLAKALGLTSRKTSAKMALFVLSYLRIFYCRTHLLISCGIP